MNENNIIVSGKKTKEIGIQIEKSLDSREVTNCNYNKI